MASKDYFSAQAKVYAKFRPTYPDALYELIYSKLNQKGAAWDCGTGNGQVAVRLAEVFDQVNATDISEKQLLQAPQASNIRYEVMDSTKTPFQNHFFDLITVAQALHWFDFDSFYQEVKRVLKPKGLFATWTYTLLKVNSAIDPIILQYYQEIIGPYWAPERKHIDQNYTNIPFPFEETETYQFSIDFEWSIDYLLGYLSSWSSTQTYICQHQENPIKQVEKQFRGVWGDGLCTVSFPILLKLGKGIADL